MSDAAGDDDEEDYLSDKFLVETLPTKSSSKTYSDLRKESLKQAAARNEANRRKSRKQLEAEALEEGLSKSLFERAQAEENDSGKGNKAMNMMLRMGFKPGEALGTVPTICSTPSRTPETRDAETLNKGSEEPGSDTKVAGQRKVPLALERWEGKMGLGVRKRAPSPSNLERIAKMAKIAEDTKRGTYRNQAREEYEERRAEGRFASARRTCLALDEKGGFGFNVLCLDPRDPDSFPKSLLDLMVAEAASYPGRSSEADRLRAQMKADALLPLGDDESVVSAKDDRNDKAALPPETVEEAKMFLRLTTRDRLTLLLGYLRRKHLYCFWCGSEYGSQDELERNCPGENEDDHD